MGLVLKSTNGGDFWNIQSTGINVNLISTYFTNYDTGWVVGEWGIILKTSNGGINWISEISGTLNDLYSIYFINDSVGWTVGYENT